MIKVNYDTNGNILGYYPDDIQYTSIPEPNIKIDEATHQDCINNPGLRKVDTVNKVIVNYTPPAPALTQVQQQQLAALSTAAADAYIAGFQSSASGTPLWYDSDVSTQNQITSASLLAIASTATFNAMYPNSLIIRAKADAAANDSAKQQYPHTASQIITLGTDMQKMLSNVKTKLWAKQAEVNAATTISGVQAVTW